MGGIKIAVWPDDARKEKIRRGVDKAAYVGCGMLLVFVALPYINWDWFTALPAYGFIGIIIVVLTPVALFLFWLEEKIRVGRLWWTAGALSWITCFALALSGYLYR